MDSSCGDAIEKLPTSKNDLVTKSFFPFTSTDNYFYDGKLVGTQVLDIIVL